MAAHPHSSGTTMRPRWSIATKLALLVVFAVSTSAAVLISISVWNETARYLETKTRALRDTAGVFASVVSQAAAERDRPAAIAAMRAIASIPDLKHARIELVDGTMLASLGSATRLDSDIRLTDGSAALSPLAVLHSGTIEVSVPIVNAGLEVGHFSVIADTSDLADQLLASLGMTFAGAAIALAVGLLIAWQLQRGITAPLRQLTGAVSEIRETHDYTARVAAAGADEVGILVGGFNAMLGEIEEREGRLEAHRRNLEADVLDRTHDLRIAKDAAESASVAKSDFLAVMSHEIRTPMNGIMVMAELLAAADLPDRQRRYAEVISKSGQSLLAIINDILDFSKIEAGKLELERVLLDTAELADDVTSLFGERARAKGLDLAAYVGSDVPSHITGDPVRLNQIIGNLVNNALKFTERGAVLLTITTEQQDGLFLRIAVRDSGVGIAADKLGDIFGAFSQADQSTTRRYGGTGLGLAICKRLVEAMAGTITVTSVVGTGSTFSISIPMEPPADMAAPPRGESGAGAPAIVAVGGEATRLALSHYLVQAGFAIVRAETVKDWNAIGKAALVIADPALLRSIPATNIDPSRVVCLATFGDAAAHRLLERGEASAVIARPVLHSEITAILDRLSRDGALRARRTVRHEEAEALPAFAGLRVLVADDSAVNREVALEALGRLGASVDMVENGRRAVEVTAERRFDVVLMDASMPEMDGFEATRRIRAREQAEGHPRIPIVAVTAHVIGDAAEAWRNAGMDAVLHKPYTIRTLAECLARMAPSAARDAASSQMQAAADVAVPQAQAAPALLDRDMLDQLAAMTQQGMHGFVERVLGLYLESAPKALDELVRALVARDLDATARAAHALKSMSLSIGASRAAAAAKTVEETARGEHAVPADTMVGALTATVNETCGAITAQLAAQAMRPEREAASG